MDSETAILGTDEDFEKALADLQRDEKPKYADPFEPEQPGNPIMDTATGKFVLTVRNRLGFKPEKWEAIKPRVIAELERIPAIKITARTLLVTSFGCIEKIEKAMEVSQMLMEKPGLSDEHRIAACHIPPLCAKGLNDLMRTAMVLAEKSSDRGPENGNRPKNRPPALAVQVNNYPAASRNQSASTVVVGGDKNGATGEAG